MEKLNQKQIDDVRTVAAALRRAAGFCHRSCESFENPATMISYAMEDVKFAGQVLAPIFEALEGGDDEK